ncbi:MAG: exosortase A, partial [Pseudomonadota bacterium]
MLPDPALQSMRRDSVLDRLPEAWRVPLLVLALSVMGMIILMAREWGEMLHQWWDIDTYNHILLIPFIIVWLVAMRMKELSKIKPQPWLPGLVLVAAGIGLWLAGRSTEINLLAHAGAVGAMQAAIVAVLGLRVALLCALPLCFGALLVPFGDEIIPPLQMITADIAIALTLWSGIPAVIDGIYIDTPVGLFIVAEACSGVKFLIAMVTLAILVCFTRFESWTKRAVFMSAAIVIPIIANGIRAWGTIYIAQSQGVEFAAGFDHIFYGWIFFAIVVALVLAGAWRFFRFAFEET